MATFNTVIETVTGDAIKAGYCDFENDGSFDAANWDMRSDGPRDAKLKGDPSQSQMDRWNGAAWVLVAQPTIPAQVPDLDMLGLQVSTTSVTALTVEPGHCRDSLDQSNLVVSAQLSAAITASGAGGLDTGAEASSTWYAVHVITDTTLTNAPAALLSLSHTAPTIPTGYDLFRHVGWVRNDSSSDFLSTEMRGNHSEKAIIYDEDVGTLAVLTDGSSLTFADVDLSALVPPTAMTAILEVEFETGGGGASATDRSHLKPKGFATTDPVFRASFGVKSSDKGSEQFTIPCDSSQLIEYFVDGSQNRLTICVSGYIDTL